MPIDPQRLGIFLVAAVALAVTPGPGIFYVLARSLRGGRAEGFASSFGTAVGGLGHVVAAAIGLSAALAASATAFTIVKYAGAAYLIYLGVATLRSRHGPGDEHGAAPPPGNSRQAFVQGIVTEALNPKTALFFLAFIPQFIDPARPALGQFLLLGCVSVALNTAADLVVASFAGPIGQWLRGSPGWQRAQRRLTGWALIGLGAYVALADSRRT
jgi:threonine/homoserine/homoserine lactone efflux protein